jgi:hypothetical protein
MTLEAWVYPTVNMTQWAAVVLKEQPGGGLYELYANGDRSQPLTSVTVGGQYRVLSAGPWLLANQWTHLAATYDGTTQRLYVNGTQVAQRPQTGPTQVSSSPLRLGGNSVWGEFFKGRIDEVRVYNRALSTAAINADLSTAIATSAPSVFLIGNQQLGVRFPLGAPRKSITYMVASYLLSRRSGHWRDTRPQQTTTRRAPSERAPTPYLVRSAGELVGRQGPGVARTARPQRRTPFKPPVTAPPVPPSVHHMLLARASG